MAPPTTRRSWLSTVATTFLTISATVAPTALATSSSKRGLAFTPNANWGQDNYIWTRKPSDLTWYYNYQAAPSPVYSNLTQDAFEFVPMLWGAPADTSDTTFLKTVQGLIKGGRNISHVMSFNEPDGPSSWGSSDVDPTVAAKVWVNNIIPLQEMGVKVGLPACTGGWSGLPWTRQFLGNCSKLISTGTETKNCTFDFVPLHWYGNFEGLASHIGEWYAAFNETNPKIWVTEYNLDHADLQPTQEFFNNSAAYMDRLDYLERYSLFGAFRSSVSNIGPNGAMLSAGGQLTDIGAWYLGRSATGVSPSDTKTAGAGMVLPPGWSGFALGAAAAFGVTALLF